MPTDRQLTRREREIMAILYRSGEARAREVLEAMREPPSYSAVRAFLRLLEEKGHVRHKQVGRSYVFRPTVGPARARRSALRHVVDTFFSGSAEQCVASILDMEVEALSSEELERLAELIEKAKKNGG
jgi:predicted transcriptional regulator